MPNWNQLLDEIRASGSMYDVVRRRRISQQFPYGNLLLQSTIRP